MLSKSLIENYIQLISKEGFINEDSNIFFKNIGAQNEEVFYDDPTTRCIKQIKGEYIEGRYVNIVVEVGYSTFKNFESAEILGNYIDTLIENRKNELTKEIICIDAITNLKHLIEEEGYQCDNIFYDFPYAKGYSFSFVEFPSNKEYHYKNIEQTDFITISEISDGITKKVILKYDEIVNLTNENIISFIKQKLDDKN